MFPRSIALLLCALPALALSSYAQTSQNVTCTKRKAALTAADRAFGDERWDKAASLYLADASFNDEEGWRNHDGAIRSLLEDGKLEAAEAVLAKMKSRDAKNPWTLLAISRVEWREGHLDAGIKAAVTAYNAGPCNPMARFHLARINNFAGNHATARRDYITAHALDAMDIGIWRAWIFTLPRAKRAEELDKYLAESHDFKKEREHGYANLQVALRKAPSSDCRLVTPIEHTSIPLRHVGEGTAYDPFGVDIQIEGKRRRLELDTGASGIVLSREAAAALHLESYMTGNHGGIGDEGLVKSSSAIVKSLKIGNLVFENCTVDVMTDTNKALRGTDGLIGGDVFSDFLLTLDFPGRQLALDPLPPLPGQDKARQNVSLDTSGDDSDRMPRDRYVDPSMKNWVRNFSSGSHIFIPVQVGTGPMRLFLVDTGAGLCNISRRTAQESGKVSNGSMMNIVGISGEVKKTFTTSPLQLTFAGLQVPPQSFVGFDTAMLNESTGVEVGGILGAPVLDLLTIKIDYRDDLISFGYDPKRIIPLY